MEHKITKSKCLGSLLYENYDNVVLHENILDILFQHKSEVYKKLIDLRGTFLIDHMALKLIDPSNRLVVFSITPSVEYNLIVQGMWKYDKGFSRNFQKNNSFYVWGKAYSKEYFEEIKFLKEKKHGFTFGFNISKIVGEFTFIYSYATRCNNRDLHDYYQNHIYELSAIGDYGYKLIHGIYAHYCSPDFKLPFLSCKQNFSKPQLTLLINNTL